VRLQRIFAECSVCAWQQAAKAQPPAEEGGKGESKKNPFTQYYAQLLHQQNMLQDSVRTGGSYHRLSAALSGRLCPGVEQFIKHSETISGRRGRTL
jgi:hypothetical protein